MNLLPVKDMRTLAELQLRAVNLDAQIAHITEVMEELVYDECSLRITVSLFNRTRMDQEKAKAYIDKVLADPPVNNFTGSPVGVKHYSAEPPRAIEAFDEMEGLIVMGAMRNVLEARRASVLLQMEQLINDNLIASPTTALYHERL